MASQGVFAAIGLQTAQSDELRLLEVYSDVKQMSFENRSAYYRLDVKA